MGCGVEGWSSEALDSARIGSLSLDAKPWLYPIYLGLDLSGSSTEAGFIRQNGVRGNIEANTSVVSVGPKVYQTVYWADVYAGLMLTWQKTDQRFSRAGVVRDLMDQGLGTTAVLGVGGVEVFIPHLEWGVEFRYTKVDLDAITDVEPSSGTWLLTSGISW